MAATCTTAFVLASRARAVWSPQLYTQTVLPPVATSKVPTRPSGTSLKWIAATILLVLGSMRTSVLSRTVRSAFGPLVPPPSASPAASPAARRSAASAMSL